MDYHNAHRTHSQWPHHPQYQQRRRQNSIFQVSNPSASDDHDQDPQADFDLEYTSPPSSQCHCYETPTATARSILIPPLVVDEKRWRRRFLRSGGRRPRGEFAGTVRDRDMRKGRSVSPPRYTADEFEYPEGGEEEAYSREDDVEHMHSPTAYEMATIPDRALLNPFPYHSYTGNTPSQYAPPPPRIYAPPAEHYVSRDVPAHRPSVLFAEVRPLSITRRRFSRQTRVQVTNHPQSQSQAQSHLPKTTTTQRRRHSEGQAFSCPHPHPHPYPYPTTPSMTSGHGMASSQGHGDPFSQHQPWTACTPEFMGKSSSHDRNGGRSYTSSSTLNNRRMTAAAAAGVAHRPEHTGSREIHSFSGPQRCPPIRLAVQGLSYVDEDPEFHHHLAPSPISSDVDVDVDVRGPAARPRPQPPRLHPFHHPSTSTPFQNQSDLGGVRRVSESRPHARDAKARNERTRAVSRQPQPHPGMQAKPGGAGAGGGGGGNRNFKRMPYAEDGKRDWSTDMCLFCDHNLGTCCKALWCPCIIYGRNKARIEHLYAEDKVHPTKGGTFSNDCAIHACLTTFCLFGWAIQVPNRASIRRRYNIEGDWLGDCAAALFCSPCELSQESREIDLEERSITQSLAWSKEGQDVA